MQLFSECAYCTLEERVNTDWHVQKHGPVLPSFCFSISSIHFRSFKDTHHEVWLDCPQFVQKMHPFWSRMPLFQKCGTERLVFQPVERNSFSWSSSSLGWNSSRLRRVAVPFVLHMNIKLVMILRRLALQSTCLSAGLEANYIHTNLY